MIPRHVRFRAALGLGGLDEPPPPAAYLRFPAEFGRRFLICVDTEEEFDWTQPKRRDATSTRAVRTLPIAHGRLRGFGVDPVYMVDYPVANAAESIAVLRGFVDAGECEIGAQLHPWVNPPFTEELSARNSFAGNLPRAVERDKLIALTTRLTEAFGHRPLAYRAGRYGVGPNTEALLDEAGYRIDVSVRALFDYRDEGGPSFAHIPATPYWAGPSRRLLEVPLSATYVGLLRHYGGALFGVAGRVPRMRGVLSRSGLLGRVALTPEGIPLGEALAGVRQMLADGAQLLSLSFHSPSVEPGHTPYVRDADDLRRFYGWWDGVLDLLAREGVTPMRISELIAAADAVRG